MDLNIYEQVINIFYGSVLNLPTGQVKENPFANLLINKFEKLYPTLTIRITPNQNLLLQEKARIILTKENLTKLKDKVNYMKNKEIKITLGNYPGIHVKKDKNNKIVIEPGNLNHLVAIFVNKDIGFLIAFAIITLQNLKFEKEIYMEPSKEIISNIRKIVLYEAFSKIKRVGHDYTLEDIIHTIDNLKEQIKAIEKDIKSNEQKLREREKSFLFQEFNNKAKKVVDYITRHSLIRPETIVFHYSSTTQRNIIKFDTKPLYLYKMNKEFLEKSRATIYPGKDDFKDTFDEILYKNARIGIGTYEINITIHNNPGTFEIKANPTSKYEVFQNPHHKIGCLGGFAEGLQESKREGDLLAAISIILEYLQSVNFGDPGSSQLPNLCYVADQHNNIIYPKNTRNDQNDLLKIEEAENLVKKN